MNEVQVSSEGRRYTFEPGQTIRIGRSSDNDVIVSDPTVSRQHAKLAWGPDGWVFEGQGRAGTFLRGRTVTRLVIREPVELSLASPQGPVVRIEPASQAGPAPSRTADSILDPGPAAPPCAGATRRGAPQIPAGAAAAAGPAPTQGPAAAQGPVLAEEPGAATGPAPAATQGPVPAQEPGAAAGPAATQGPVPVQGLGAAAGPAPTQGPAAAPGPAAQGRGTAWGPAAGGGHAVPAGPRIGAAGGSRDEFASAFQILVPVRSWLKDPGWRQGLRLLVIPYALLPLVFQALFLSSGNLTTPGWSYSLYVAPLWAIAFWLLIRPGPVGRQELLLSAGIIVFVMIWMTIITININGHLNPKSFGNALAVGYNEEISKALPILVAALLLLKLRSLKLDVRMWMFLGTISGLAFGVREASAYTSKAIVNIALAHSANQAVAGALFFAYRVFVDGFQHAIWAGVAAFFIGMAVNYPRRRVQLIIFGVTIAAALHALNDWYLSNFSSPLPWILLQAFSLLLFLGYTMSAASIERKVRRTPMFRGESMLMDKFSETGESPSS